MWITSYVRAVSWGSDNPEQSRFSGYDFVMCRRICFPSLFFFLYFLPFRFCRFQFLPTHQFAHRDISALAAVEIITGEEAWKRASKRPWKRFGAGFGKWKTILFHVKFVHWRLCTLAKVVYVSVLKSNCANFFSCYICRLSSACKRNRHPVPLRFHLCPSSHTIQLE